MRHLRLPRLCGLLGSWLCLASAVLWAEAGVLVVHVKDVRRRPVSGVQIGVDGDGGSAVTGDDGKARIRLARQTKENSWVSLQILNSPRGKDFVMVSPWDYRTGIPSFENESENFVEVVLVQRGDRAALESGALLVAITAQLNKANAPKTAPKEASQENTRENLNAVAKQYGLRPEELDQAIRAWGAKTTDPYEVGLAALYERNYSKASVQLADSLQKREEKLAADRKAVADAAFFLGQSLWEEGKYRDSAAIYQRCLQLRPDDSTILSKLALSLTYAGDYAAAEPLYRRALEINEKAWGTGNPSVAFSLNELGVLLRFRGDYAAAEQLFRRALEIQEKTLGPDNPQVAASLNNWATVLEDLGDYASAEQLFRRALAIDQKTLKPDDSSLACTLNNLATVLEAMGNDRAAEPLFRESLTIYEKAVGPDHPGVANPLINLALLLHARGDYRGAEPLYRRALSIREKALGPNHPDVAASLTSLAEFLRETGDYAAAEPLARRALAIDEKALGPNHPTLAVCLNNLALLLTTQRRSRYTSVHWLSMRRHWGPTILMWPLI